MPVSKFCCQRQYTTTRTPGSSHCVKPPPSTRNSVQRDYQPDRTIPLTNSANVERNDRLSRETERADEIHPSFEQRAWSIAQAYEDRFTELTI